MWKAVKAQMSEQEQHQELPENNDDEGFDFTHVNSVARIALYDNLLSAPRVTEIQPAPTGEFIESLATNVYQQSQAAGGTIPYTVIREVSENFIHARFQEATVSILDHGCTIRFADQGPGIACKDRAQLPGFTSAIEPMKSYIRGVGSGLPIVKEYLDFTHGTINIEDNLGTGSVVTISANGSNPQLPKELEINHVEEDEDAEHPEPTAPRYRIAEEDHEPAYNAQPAYAQPSAQYAPGFAAQPPMQAYQQAPQVAYAAPQQFAQPGYAPAAQQGYMQAPIQQPMGYPYGQQMQQQPQIQPAPVDAQPIIASLSQREKDFLVIYLKEGVLGVSDVVKLTGAAQSSVHNTLKKLEGIGLLKMSGKKRMLTNLGIQVAQLL